MTENGPMTDDPRGFNGPIAHEEMHDGVEVGVYRASAVGMCEHALLAARMGIEGAAPPDTLQKVFSEGHDNESAILDLFYGEVDYLESATRGIRPGLTIDKTVELTIGDSIIIRGHVDDIAVHGTMVRVVVEVKAVGKDLWRQWEAAQKERGQQLTGEVVFAQLTGLWQKYRDQAEVYMAASGASECAFVVGRKPERVTDAEGDETRGLVEEISYVWLKPDPARLGRIKARIAMVEGRARAGASLPKVCEEGVYGCPYYYLLHEKKEKKPTTKIESERLAAALREHYEAGVAEKAAKTEKDNAKKVLDELWRALQTNERSMDAGEVYECGGYTVEYVERAQPAGTRKAYVQKFYTVKKTKG